LSHWGITFGGYYQLKNNVKPMIFIHKKTLLGRYNLHWYRIHLGAQNLTKKVVTKARMESATQFGQKNVKNTFNNGSKVLNKHKDNV